MIHIKEEGGVIRQGISFYHPQDSSSIGVCLRIGNRLWRVRYSKITKHWKVGYHKADPAAYENLLNFPKRTSK